MDLLIRLCLALLVCLVVKTTQEYANNEEQIIYEVNDQENEYNTHFSLFEDFLTTHGKKYANQHEYFLRFRIFRANLKKINYLQRTEQGSAEYGITEMADLTATEFKKKYLGLKRASPKEIQSLEKADIPDIQLPNEFDWRNYNIVTPVKDQKSCGSCWAFSVTGNVEGLSALKHGKLYSLSEQELVDCDTMDSGCNGGLPITAYDAIKKIGGLESEDDYPYDAKDEECKFNKSAVLVTVSGGLNISKDETEMAKWLVKNGPISVGINANAMQFYRGGVSHPLKFLCSKDELDHGVLIVGYGVHNTTIRHKILPYWLIKNSWGRSWGEKGYYRVYRGDGTCGVNQMATSAIVE